MTTSDNKWQRMIQQKYLSDQFFRCWWFSLFFINKYPIINTSSSLDPSFFSSSHRRCSVTYSSSYNLTPAISRVLIGEHLIFCSPIYKFQGGLAPPIMSDLFITRENNYNLRNFQELESSLRRTVKFGTETISYRGPQIWNLIPERIRTLETLNKFKKEIKSWKCDACPCRMCKTYIQRVGFIN